MVGGEDPRSDDPRTGEPGDDSDPGEELDVFTGDPLDALFDVEMTGEAEDDAEIEDSGQGLGEIAEFSVDARSGEELPPELAPPVADPKRPRPDGDEPFELELLDPTDPGITREDLDALDDEPPEDEAAASVPSEHEPVGEGPVNDEPEGDGADPDDETEPPRGATSDAAYAALAAIVGDEDDEDDDAPGVAADDAPAASPKPGPFDDVPSAATTSGDDDRYAWLYDEDVEPPPALTQRYLADEEPGTSVPAAEEAADAPVSPAEPDDETRIVDLPGVPASSGRPGDGQPPAERLPDEVVPDELPGGPPGDPAPGDPVLGDPEHGTPPPDANMAPPDTSATDVDQPEAASEAEPGSASDADAPRAAGAAPAGSEDEGGEDVEDDGSDDPFALAGSIFDDVEPEPHETDWESFTGEHVLSSTQEYVGLAEELTRAEPPSEQMAVSAGIPGLETSLVGLDDVVGMPADVVVDETRPDLALRILSGFGLLALFAVSLVWSPAVAVFAVLLFLLAAGELYAVLVANGRHPVAAFGLAGVAGCLVGTWVWGLVAVPVSLTVSLIAVALFVATSTPRPAPLDDTALTLLGVAWIGGLGAFALPIITAPDYRWLIAGVVAVVAALDIGQYFVGRRFGSRQLAPVLSPKKTVEGLIGGAIAALLVGVLLSFLGPFDRMSAMLLAGAAGAFGPLGDLSVSMVKRILAVKDMGTVLPGHGGILDRIDALLFVIPAAWVVLRATGLLA